MESVFFNENTHTYTTPDDKELISVTTLMKKHGLSPSFNNVPKHILKASKLRGNELHKNTHEYVQRVFPNARDTARYEVVVANDHVAGTIDAIFSDIDKQLYIIDLKTGQYLEDACRWQLSLYEYLYGSKNKAKLIILHLDKEDNVKLIDLTKKRIPRLEIDKLIEADKNGEIYSSPTYELADVNKEYAKDLVHIQDRIGALERQISALKEIEANARLHIMQEMTKRGIDFVHTPSLLIKYVQESVRSNFNLAAFKQDHPNMYKKYLVDSCVREHLRITLKEIKNA